MREFRQPRALRVGFGFDMRDQLAAKFGEQRRVALVAVSYTHLDVYKRQQLLNLLGAIGILLSLLGKFNLPVFLLEIAWVVVSLYGIARSFKAKKTTPA